MSTLPTLAVTGSTGALGGAVARLLAEAGVPQRLVVRDPDRAPLLEGAEPVPFVGYGDAASSAQALEGAETLFMVSASESADRLEQHRALVAAAADAGVRRVVYTSFAAAAPDCTFTLGRDHAATEETIRSSGMEWTFLRDNFYLDFFAFLPGEDGVIRGPAGDGRCAAVARADVARCAAAVLQTPDEHTGTTYDLTGPEAITLGDAARILSEHRGEEVRYHDETLEEAYASRASYGAPDWQLDAWVSTYTAIATGELAEVSDDVRRLTGRVPTDLRTLLRQG